MNFSEDFILIQGILNNAHKTIGDFSTIRHRGGNEAKIKTIVDDIRKVLTDKKYYRKGKLNPKHEESLREINLFLILNTELSNKQIFANDNKFAHLIDVVPQLSKCLLTNVIWGLEFYRFYSEAIYSLPIEISVELLEHVNSCIKRSEPYLVLEQVALITLAIYVKLYGIRTESVDEEKVNNGISKLLEKFTQILQNYITPKTDQMQSWPTSEMYQYMGVAVYKILHLLRCAFDIFLEKNPVGLIHEIYQVNTSGPAHSPERLDKSGQALKKCNICLMSVCEANLQAITVDIFCSWSEYKHNEAYVQKMIGTLAYEVRQHLNSFEGCGNLPHMLEAIMTKPKTIDESIKDADETTLLKNVLINNDDQMKWIEAFIDYGVLTSDETFSIFKLIIHLCNEDNYLCLLKYTLQYTKNNDELKKIILKNITNLDEKILIKTIAKHFQNCEINNAYESEHFNTQLGEILNKMIAITDEKLSTKEISVLVLQNPSTFLYQLIVETLKNPEQLENILKIIEYIKPVCMIQQKENSPFLTEIILKFLKEYNLEPEHSKLLTEFLNKLEVKYLTIRNIVEDLLILTNYFLEENVLSKSIIMLQILKDLTHYITLYCKNDGMLLTLADILSKTRWNFLTYSDEKLQIVTLTIALINKFKELVSKDTIDLAKNKLEENSINSYYLMNQDESFINVVFPQYEQNEDHNNQVYHLLMVLPCCDPDEWNLIGDNVINDKNYLEILKVYTEVILILSEITKKSKNLMNSLSYCFQQFLVTVKNKIFPRLKDTEKYKVFIKNICNLIRHLPSELQNTIELSLINLFDFDTIKTMKDDNDFIYILYSISHLEICKIILCKIQ